MSAKCIPAYRRGPARGTKKTIPFKGHRCMAEVMAEERGEKYVSPQEFKDAVDFDNQIRNCGVPGMARFINARRVPLEDIDFQNLEDKGQLNMFENECEGLCGV
tara:strand:+ start:371 stop:682 length:312 start_codon:yes stop_codon:yes gene_type:complete